MNIIPKQLLSQLVKNKVITQDQADQYEIESLQKNLPIDKFLFDFTNIKREEIIKAIAQVFDISYISLENVPNDPQATTLISESIAKRFQIVPYKFDQEKNILYIASFDPFNTFISDFLEKKTGKRIIFVLADPIQIKKTIEIIYGQGLTPEVKEALKEYQPKKETILEETKVKEAPIAKIVATIVEFAIRGRASDIHIEPQENAVRVRYRIDGILHEKLVLPKIIQDGVISRIKILSGMKIDEKRIPQDGRFSYQLNDEEVDLRVSTLPTVYGEKVVMRLLKKTGGIPQLHELGLRGTQLKDLEEAISKPYGIILVTGPTGSGKTTTLYSVLSRLNTPKVNIMTLEDPVEYQIPGINQVQINPQAGLTFASGLRAFLRQDPNIILVGEIRDKETTQLAIQAALTGHLVFSTLHTNDSATAIPRLIDLGAEPFLIASVLNAVVAQRICRRICQFCKKEYEPDETLKKNIFDVLGDLIPRPYKDGEKIILTKGEGCKECNNTGYLGRIAIFEVLKVSINIIKLILKQESAKEIESQAKKEGLITMKQDGYLKVLDGITTIEEVLRVAEV
jgi:type IV pilus assembly protein PilB